MEEVRNKLTLQEQAHKTLQSVGIPITVFCNRMQISTVAYYRWLHNDLRLSTEKEAKIRNYIKTLSKVCERLKNKEDKFIYEKRKRIFDNR